MSALLVFTHLLAFLVGGFCGVLVLALGRVVHDDDPEEGGRRGPPSADLPDFRPPPRRGRGRRTLDMIAIVAAALAAATLGAPLLHAETAASVDAAAPMTATRPAPPAPGGDNADQYCEGIMDAARDARFARQKAALDAMEKQIEDRIAKLEAKRAEYESWLARREEFLRKADDAVIAVFSQMRPDAASAQLTIMGDDPAAAILAKLNARVASAILNEMDPARAARLTSVMVGIGKRPQPGGKSS